MTASSAPETNSTIPMAMQQPPLARKQNPCISLYGPGPTAALCRTCSHLIRSKPRAHTYYKCELRTITGGAATDHRLRWPACARYQEQ